MRRQIIAVVGTVRVRKVIIVTGGKRVEVKLKLFFSVYNAESNLVKLT